jgi:hypothetical protein
MFETLTLRFLGGAGTVTGSKGGRNHVINPNHPAPD